jgi:hypothetical protein
MEIPLDVAPVTGVKSHEVTFVTPMWLGKKQYLLLGSLLRELLQSLEVTIMQTVGCSGS